MGATIAVPVDLGDPGRMNVILQWDESQYREGRKGIIVTRKEATQLRLDYIRVGCITFPTGAYRTNSASQSDCYEPADKYEKWLLISEYWLVVHSRLDADYDEMARELRVRANRSFQSIRPHIAGFDSNYIPPPGEDEIERLQQLKEARDEAADKVTYARSKVHKYLPKATKERARKQHLLYRDLSADALRAQRKIEAITGVDRDARQ